MNHRVIEEELPDLQYGFSFSFLLHYIHILRYKFPETPIVISKYDMKSAYRRGTMWGKFVTLCGIILGTLAALMLCLVWS